MDRELLKEYTRRQIKKSYYLYTQHVISGFIPNRVHKLLGSLLDEFWFYCTGKTIDLMNLSISPRAGKSMFVTETSGSYLTGLFPKVKCMVLGYNTVGITRFGRRNRDLLEAFGQELFGVNVSDSVGGSLDWETTTGSVYHTAGMESAITGFGSNFLIIDDPVKNRADSKSETIMSKIHESIGPDIISRLETFWIPAEFALNAAKRRAERLQQTYIGDEAEIERIKSLNCWKDGKVKIAGKGLTIQTRWIEDDVIGLVRSKLKEYIYLDINIPAECVDPENDPLGRELGEGLSEEYDRGKQWVKDEKAIQFALGGPEMWEALYQGNPNIEGGNIFKQEWFRYYDKKDLPDLSGTFLSVDATFSKSDTSDYVAISKWGVSGNNIYLLDLINKRMSFVETVDAIKEIITNENITETIIENKANGAAIIDQLSHDFPDAAVVPVTPLGGKIARANATTAIVREQRIYLPKLSGFLQEFMHQMTHFPTVKNDDIVDSSTQAWTRIKWLLGQYDARWKPETPTRKAVNWTALMWEDYNYANYEMKEKLLQKWGDPY